MGYLSRVSGEISVSPIIPHKLMVKLIEAGLADHPKKGLSGTKDVSVYYDINTTDSDEGIVTSYEGHCITSAFDGEFKAYTLAKDVQEVVDILGDGFTYSGFLEISGEDDSDLWRIVIKDGKLKELHPKIVWPED